MNVGKTELSKHYKGKFKFRCKKMKRHLDLRKFSIYNAFLYYFFGRKVHWGKLRE